MPGWNAAHDLDLKLHAMLAALPAHPDQFRRLCGEVTGWEEFLEHADQQGVLAILYHYLAPSEAGPSAALRSEIERRLAFQRLVQLRLHAALDQVMSALEAAGLDVLVLKGPVLGERLYPEASLRASGDLDLLTSPENLDRAVAVLAAIGYQADDSEEERYFREHHHHIHLYRPQSPPIELHFRLYAGFGTIAPAGGFLARASSYRTARGLTLRILAPEDELLYLCVHAAGHRFRSLAGLYDLKLFLERYPDLDWATISTRARSLGLFSAVAFSGEILRRRFGLAGLVPPGFAALPPLRSRPASFLLSLQAAQRKGSALATLTKWAYSAALCDRPGASARYLGHTVSWVVRNRARRIAAQVLGGPASRLRPPVV